MHPTHGRQWLFGTPTNGVCPYSRCTGNSGQMVEHHPLLPFNSHPPTAAPTATAPSRPARATPVSLNQIFRPITAPTKMPVARTYPYSASQRGAVAARDTPRLRDAWFNAASGHTFRQAPGTTRNTNGSIGTSTPQNSVRVLLGAATAATTMAASVATLTTRTARHTPSGTRVRIAR